MTQNINVAISNAETARANRAREAETRRHNTVVEFEEQRAHKAIEQHNRNVLAEQTRHAIATEHQARSDLAERNRAARKSEELRASELAESRRHSMASERIQSSYNSGQLRARADELRETHRHNVVGEQVSVAQQQTRELEVRGNLMLREQQLQQDLLLGSERNRIQERDVYFQHADRLGRMDIDSYRAKTDRYGTIVSGLSSLLKGGTDGKR